MNQQVLEKTAHRLKLLDLLYDYVNGNPAIGVRPADFYKYASTNGIALTEVQPAWQYLLAERLVTTPHVGQVGITHDGVKEVERARTRPDDGTEHFPAAAIHQVLHFHGAVGGIQTGSHNTMNVAQQINVPPEILGHFAALRAEAQKLPEDKRSTALELVDDIEEESKKETPKLSRLNAYAASLSTLLTTMGPAIAVIIEWIMAIKKQ